MLYDNQRMKKLLLPLVVEQVLVMLVGMADTMMASSLGDAAISGVSLMDMICVIIIALLSALASGGAVVAAQYLGAKKEKDACRVSNQLVLVNLAISLTIMIGILALQRPLLKLLFGQADEAVTENALRYLRITAFSYPFVAMYEAGAALFRSMNRSIVTMKVSFIMNVINVSGNALCLYGLGMGVEGVAIPTLLARIVGAVCMLLLLRDPHLQIHLLPDGWKPNRVIVREVMRIGIPGGLENCLFQLGRVLVVGVITVFGTVQIAANAVQNTLNITGYMPGQIMNLAIITVVGQCVGAGDYAQAKYYTKKMILWAYLATIALNVPMILTLRWTVRLFSVSAEAQELAIILSMIHNGFAMLLWPASFVLPKALRAASDSKYPMIIAVLSMAMFRIVFSYILGIGFGWGAIGVNIAMILDWIFRTVCYVHRYRSGKWMNLSTIALRNAENS